MKEVLKVKRDMQETMQKWQEWLWLSHWVIQTIISKSSEGTVADISLVKRGLFAQIRIDGNFILKNSDKAGEYVVHEMVHLFLYPLEDWMKKITELLPKKTANLVREEWKDKEEEIVLKLSDLLMDLESGKLQAEYSQKKGGKE